MLKLILCLFFFVNFFAKALSLNKIFKFDDAPSLKLYVREQNHQQLLKALCDKQKENRKPPTACYELALPVDSWCLRLNIHNLSVKTLNEAIKSSFLSSLCSEHLKEKHKILIYRQKDFLLPELKNYWTGENSSF